MSGGQIYETIGVGYSVGRRPDPRWQDAIDSAIGDAKRVINIGAGTGSYKPNERAVIAVEPSKLMVGQRPRSAAPVVMAAAENVPIVSGWADLTMTLLSFHHWTNWRAGISEMRRLAPRWLVLTYDPDLHASFWLLRDYLPEVAASERTRTPKVEDIANVIGWRRSDHFARSSLGLHRWRASCALASTRRVPGPAGTGVQFGLGSGRPASRRARGSGTGE